MKQPLWARIALVGSAMGFASFGFAPSALADAELAKQLNNPVASLISVPFQLDYNQDLGADDDGSVWALAIEPVIPFSIGENWNLISRTIITLEKFEDLPDGSGTDFGIADTQQAFYFSPKATKNGWTWGAGPLFQLPTSRWNDSDSRPKFGASEWGAGVTGVALRQVDGWTYGALAGHIWDIDGDTDVSITNLQPFLAYSTPDAWTFALNSESIYNHEADDGEEWSIPVNFMVSKVVKVGGAPIQLKGGVRYWADSPDGGAEGWGGRFALTLLFPK